MGTYFASIPFALAFISSATARFFRLLVLINTFRLAAGSVVTVEPGIYIPGEFGVRIEDVMHLTADGAEILTRSPKNLIIL